MTANELAYKLEKVSNDMEHSYVVNDWKLLFESALVLRKQAQEIEQLKERLEETRQLYLKQLAITHSDTQSHPMQELSHEEIDNIFGICALNTTVTLTTEQCYWIVDAILRKASEK